MQFTVNELSETMDIEYSSASALCKLGVAQGSIREVGKRPQPSGKGKPSTIFETEQAVLQFDLRGLLKKNLIKPDKNDKNEEETE